MSKLALKLCDVCQVNSAKYKCPKSAQSYCSVACFKVIKSTHPAYATADDAFVAVEASADDEQEVLPPPKPLKKLRNLKWPPEPDAALWDDPLARTDPKPLRQDQFLKIAQSQEMRDFIQDNPDLKALLKSAFESTRNPETKMRDLLGVNARSTNEYDNHAQPYRGRGGRATHAHQRGRGRGRGSYSHTHSTRATESPSSETALLMQRFGDLVSKILEEDGT